MNLKINIFFLLSCPFALVGCLHLYLSGALVQRPSHISLRFLQINSKKWSAPVIGS
jgi:hypothetical protein